MKKVTTSNGRKPINQRAPEVLKSLRDARKVAAREARLHGVPIVYLRDGKIVRDYQR